MIIRRETKQQSRNNPFLARSLSAPWLLLFLHERTHPYRTSGITQRLPSPLYDIGNPKMRIKVHPLLSSFPCSHSRPTATPFLCKWRGCMYRCSERLCSSSTQKEEMRVNWSRQEPRKTTTSGLFANRIHPGYAVIEIRQFSTPFLIRCFPHR